MVRPLTVQARVAAVAVQVLPSGFEVTRYEVIAAPPVFAGAVTETATAPFVADVTVGAAGVPGLVAGVTAAEVVALEKPSEF